MGARESQGPVEQLPPPDSPRAAPPCGGPRKGSFSAPELQAPGWWQAVGFSLVSLACTVLGKCPENTDRAAGSVQGQAGGRSMPPAASQPALGLPAAGHCPLFRGHWLGWGLGLTGHKAPAACLVLVTFVCPRPPCPLPVLPGGLGLGPSLLSAEGAADFPASCKFPEGPTAEGLPLSVSWPRGRRALCEYLRALLVHKANKAD